MKIERLQVGAFGGLREFDSGPEPLPNFVVVLGPNEAGKSSLTEVIRASLHGIYPATRDRNKWAPWAGERLSISAVIQGADGTRTRVERKLLSQPQGTLTWPDDRTEDLRNRPHPAAEHVAQEVYAQVHRITLPELMNLRSGSGWVTLRDRILAGVGIGDLGSPRVVAADLEDRANRLWRPDRRAKSVSIEVEQRLDQRSNDLRAARDRQADSRLAQRAKAEAELSLAELRRRRTELREKVRGAREALPLAGQLRGLDAKITQAGPALGRVAEFPTDPVRWWDERVEKRDVAQGRIGALERELEDIAAKAPQNTPWDDLVGTSLGPLRTWLERRSVIREIEERVRNLRDQIEEDHQVARIRATETLVHPAVIPSADALSSIPLREVGNRLLARSEAEQALILLREARTLVPEGGSSTPGESGSPGANPRPASTFWILFGLGGVTVLVALAQLLWGGFGDQEARGGVGGVALLGGLLMMLLAAVMRSSDHRRREAALQAESGRIARLAELDARIATQEAARTRARAAAETALKPLIVRPDRLEGSGETLISDLNGLRDACSNLARLEQRRDTDKALIQLWLDAGRAILEPFGLGTPPLDPSRIQVEFDQALQRGEDTRGRAAAAARLLETLNGARSELEGVRTQLATFETGLQSLFQERIPDSASDATSDQAPGRAPFQRWVAEGAARLEAARDAERIRRDLESAHGDLQWLRATVSQSAADPELEALGGIEGAEATLEELDRQLEVGVQEIQAKQHKIESALSGDTPDAIESEIAELQDRRLALWKDRDRLWLLAHLIRVAEREFRDRNQPRLIHDASAMLRTLTQGRYDRIRFGEDGDPDRLSVGGPALQEDHPVEAPLSTGTQEQIWFSLRLAVISVAEVGGAALPVLLDEVFVNWDSERRQGAFAAIRALSTTRQIFFLTCHPEMAREAEAAGARRIELASPPGFTDEGAFGP